MLNVLDNWTSKIVLCCDDENNLVLEYIHLLFVSSQEMFVHVGNNKSYTTGQLDLKDNTFPEMYTLLFTLSTIGRKIPQF